MGYGIVSREITHPTLVHELGDSPCIIQIDRLFADRVKDPDVVGADIFPDTDFPVVKGVDWPVVLMLLVKLLTSFS